jgi:S-adenosylmethionine:tRNA ribosyltransferase-isomerase
VLARCGELYRLEFARPVLDVLTASGEVPLPPYIERKPDERDKARYQTVYATVPGAVAAPTAGLHFDETMLEGLRNLGIEIAHITLHVGAGTFAPVRGGDLSTHELHRERVTVPQTTVDAVARAHARGGRVVAVGTTVVRALEAAAASGTLQPFDGETSLFIKPGFRFRVVDALVTNLHLPQSTLLVLVCTFAGRERVLAAYDAAVRARYRFFSYGDAMFIPRRLADDGV